MIDGSLMGVDQGSQFGQQHLAHRLQFALALKHAGELGDVGLEPVLFTIAFSRLTQIRNHRIDVVFQIGDFAARLNLNRARQIAFGHGRGDLGDGAHLVGQIGGEKINVAGEILPCAGGARNVRLAAKPALDAHFTRNVCHLVGEGCERVGHVVDRVGESGDLALRLHGEPLRQIAIGDRGHHFHDAADLLGQVGGHEVHVVREVFPGAADAGDLRLAAELALSADFAGNARNLGRKAIELVDHGVDRVLQLKNFAFHVDGDLAAQIPSRNRRRDVGDIADLGGKIRAHCIDGIGQILPCPGDARHHCLDA